ncbi:tRNA (adenosine(37)-N6)-dimethylallyltransferase MiaA [Candidatus Saccharibacteria bacterium]|nr:MAG: tRNA (adenosine(37)-N6)-dimethylallyltransferase MiaA [Candidatus Saccharibacteria bacterium]
MYIPATYDQLTITQPALVVVVGETAGGKSALGMEIAKRFNGEIICADSVTVYRGFDIGSAKPSKADQAMITHHLLDVANAAEPFTVAEFKKLAEQAIASITSKGKLPILVGGSGLYVDSVLYDYQFNSAPNTSERDVLNTMSLSELRSLAVKRRLDITRVDTANPRRLIRLIETNGEQSTRSKMRINTCVVGLKVDPATLKSQVEKRVAAMLEVGLENEVEKLSALYKWDCESMKSVGYREWRYYFAGEASLSETAAQICVSTMQLAKKQRTWFKRNNSIQWVSDPSSAVEIITTFLNK